MKRTSLLFIATLSCVVLSVSALKVTVVGGTGFVGSRVCKLLADREGVSVTSVSKSGRVPEWCQGDAWTQDVTWKSADLLNGNTDMANPDVVVSCLGVVGFDKEELKRGNGVTNSNAFASSGGDLQRSVFVSVSDELVACQDNWLPEFFGGYIDGKV